jgi:hypothetical protein
MEYRAVPPRVVRKTSQISFGSLSLPTKGDRMADVIDSMQQEIGDRLRELRPVVEEYERLKAAVAALAEVPGSTPAPPAAAASASETAPAASASITKRATRVPRKRKRAASGAAQRGIIAALEHGSHSVRELVTVTAMSDANIRGSLSRLVKEGTVSRTKRDGKTAYALG